MEEEDGGTEKRRKMGNKGSNYTSLKVQCSLFTNMIKHVFRCVTVCVCVCFLYTCSPVRVAETGPVVGMATVAA